MRTIKNYVRAALPILLGCLLFVACSDDDIAEKGVKEGLPASLTFKMVVPDLNDAVVTRAGVEQETALNQLMFLFYKKSDTSKPAFAKVIDQLGSWRIGSDGNDNSNRLYTVTISPGETDLNDNELMSGEYYLYALANWGNGFCSYDAEGYASKSLDELKSAILARESSANVLDIINNTPMTGIYGRDDGSIEIYEGENSFGKTDETRVHLRRAVAKVIFNISTVDGITFTPERYSIYHYSQSSTLMERSGWGGDQGTKPGNLSYEGNNSFSDFEDLAFRTALLTASSSICRKTCRGRKTPTLRMSRCVRSARAKPTRSSSMRPKRAHTSLSKAITTAREMRRPTRPPYTTVT